MAGGFVLKPWMPACEEQYRRRVSVFLGLMCTGMTRNLVKLQILMQQISAGARESAFRRRAQVIVMPLVCRPHFDQHSVQVTAPQHCLILVGINGSLLCHLRQHGSFQGKNQHEKGFSCHGSCLETVSTAAGLALALHSTLFCLPMKHIDCFALPLAIDGRPCGKGRLYVATLEILVLSVLLGLPSHLTTSC